MPTGGFFIESITSDTRQQDGYELREATRVFHTSYSDLESCKTDPDCPHLPYRDPNPPYAEVPASSHPLDDTMRAVRLEFHKVEDGRGDLIVHYAYAPSDAATTPYHWGFNEKVGKVNIPIFYKHAKPINNGSPTLIYCWEPADTSYTEIEEVYLVKQLTRRIKKLKPSDIERIISQHRRLHKFDSDRLYMYLAPIIQPVDNFYDTITHNWMHDYGTPSPRNSGRWGDATLEEDIAFPPDLPQDVSDVIQGFPKMIRAPFNYLVPVVQPGTVSVGVVPPKPKILMLPSGLNDPEHYKDWMNLPGMEGIQ